MWVGGWVVYGFEGGLWLYGFEGMWIGFCRGWVGGVWIRGEVRWGCWTQIEGGSEVRWGEVVGLRNELNWKRKLTVGGSLALIELWVELGLAWGRGSTAFGVRERVELGVSELGEYQWSVRRACERSSERVLCEKCNSFEVKIKLENILHSWALILQST